METKQAKSVEIQFPNIIVNLKKGGTIVFNKNDYSYMKNLSKEQLLNFKLTGAGFCITWDEFDIDLGVEYLIQHHGILENKKKKAS